MKVHILFHKTAIPIEFQADASTMKMAVLMEMIEDSTGVFQRNQRLILKGKALLPHQTLEQAKVSEGSRISLIASAARPSDAAESARVTQEKQHARLEKAASQKTRAHKESASRDHLQGSAEVWKKTGIVALREANLTELPTAVWQAGANAQSADFTGNSIGCLPDQLADMSKLTRLNLSRNAFQGNTLDGSSLARMTQLRTLSLSQNRLTSCSFLGGLKQLRVLDLSENQLTVVHESIGQLSNLERLILASNTLEEIPNEVGNLQELVSLDLAHNKLKSLPAGLGSLLNLQMLQLDDNRLRSIPPEMLEGCISLHTISVHENPITVEELRETPGFKIFDGRRRAKYSKQMDMRVLNGSSGFDEGADVPRHR